MKKLIRFLIGILQELEKLDKDKLAKELRELFNYISKQAVEQIPGISALATFLVGSWVANTFTTSRFRGFLASWGLVKGGTRVISSTTYSFLSLSLPILAAALTLYVVKKVMKTYRENQLKRNMTLVAQLGGDVQAEIQEKLEILEKAKEVGLISASECSTKISNLFREYSRKQPFEIKEFLIKKLTT